MTRNEFNAKVIQQGSALKIFAVRFTADSDDAQDLVQDTMLKALLYYNKFRKDSNLKAWLYTIMKNTFINNFRKQSKSNFCVFRNEEISSANLMFSASKNYCESAFILNDIKKALSKLPKNYYTSLMMKFDGYKYHEIAELLATPVGTVKTWVYISRKLLKKDLQHYTADFQISSGGTRLQI